MLSQKSYSWLVFDSITNFAKNRILFNPNSRIDIFKKSREYITFAHEARFSVAVIYLHNFFEKKFYIIFLSQTFQCFESETVSIWNVQFCIYVIFCFFYLIRNYRSLESSLAASMSLLHSFYSTKP